MPDRGWCSCLAVWACTHQRQQQGSTKWRDWTPSDFGATPARERQHLVPQTHDQGTEQAEPCLMQMSCSAA